jgi:hypothetical protein
VTNDEKSGKKMIEEPRETHWCETCDVEVTWENASKHPNGLGGHVVQRWVRI